MKMRASVLDVKKPLQMVLWLRALEKIQDVFVSVELTGIWSLHLLYGKSDGRELLNLFMSRFGTLTTMITFLLGMQVGVLFSPSTPTETARTALEEKDVTSVAFWAGFFLCLGIICCILSLISILTIWSLIAPIGPNNAHIILRSSICLYAVTVPVRLSLTSIYLFFVWINLFWYVLAAWQVAMPLTILCTVFILHITSTSSAVAGIIMYSGGIGDERIIESKVERELDPPDLTETLIEKCTVAKNGNIPVSEQYRIKYQEQLHILEEGGSLQLSELLLPEFQSDSEDDQPGSFKQDFKKDS